jgi:hypothetical protein
MHRNSKSLQEHHINPVGEHILDTEDEVDANQDEEAETSFEVTQRYSSIVEKNTTVHEFPPNTQL